MKRGSIWWVAFDPLTSNVRNVYPGEVLITAQGVHSKAMSNQIMTVDKSRLHNKLGVLSRADMQALENAVKIHLGL